MPDANEETNTQNNNGSSSGHLYHHRYRYILLMLKYWFIILPYIVIIGMGSYHYIDLHSYYSYKCEEVEVPENQSESESNLNLNLDPPQPQPLPETQIRHNLTVSEIFNEDINTLFPVGLDNGDGDSSSSSPRQYPYLAALQGPNEDNLCFGRVYNSTFIITRANCFIDYDRMESKFENFTDILVITGPGNDEWWVIGNADPNYVYKIKRLHAYLEFSDPDNGIHDLKAVVLVELDREIHFKYYTVVRLDAEGWKMLIKRLYNRTLRKFDVGYVEFGDIIALE